MHADLTLQIKRDLDARAAVLRKLLTNSVMHCNGDSILLSGGLDTSIVTAVACKLNPKLAAYTVILKESAAPDLYYSKLISAQLNLLQEIIEVDLQDIEECLPRVIKVLRTFDPMEVRNSVPILLGLERAKSRSCSRVLTGDAADELFAGYNFIFKLPKNEAVAKLRHLWSVMHFSSVDLAKSLGIQAALPFLDKEVRDFAEHEIPYEFLVHSDESGHVYGKYILRKAFEDLLPGEIIWRKKTPIEYGSGTTVLSQIYSGKIADDEFAEKRSRYLQSDRVRLRDKEQLHYYEIFRRELGAPITDSTKRMCPACRSNVSELQNFCTTCGEFPI